MCRSKADGDRRCDWHSGIRNAKRRERYAKAKADRDQVLDDDVEGDDRWPQPRFTDAELADCLPAHLSALDEVWEPVDPVYAAEIRAHTAASQAVPNLPVREMLARKPAAGHRRVITQGPGPDGKRRRDFDPSEWSQVAHAVDPTGLDVRTVGLIQHRETGGWIAYRATGPAVGSGPWDIRAYQGTSLADATASLSDYERARMGLPTGDSTWDDRQSRVAGSASLPESLREARIGALISEDGTPEPWIPSRWTATGREISTYGGDLSTVSSGVLRGRVPGRWVGYRAVEREGQPVRVTAHVADSAAAAITRGCDPQHRADVLASLEPEAAAA
ncbi:hypothetical protein [Oryzihumus leptocrescens]|uniref:Uncharacterized protein n=1 Tax=Oryzihumus leptocrescens TaxID=297536 RepID=A0A542ZEQ9_9MICO|nr:hypothetical protein [Oryzihumus leptocrescens]TQL58750.1 hypothetical protein FB474_0086 [Oryzihumus leptocrescens]